MTVMAERRTAAPKEDLICVGAIGAAKGLRGELRVKSFTTDIEALGDYGPLTDETGAKTFEVKVIGQSKGLVVVRIKGVNDRNAADALKGQTLFIERSRLPQTDEDEFYFSDLKGLKVELADGSWLIRPMVCWSRVSPSRMNRNPKGTVNDGRRRSRSMARRSADVVSG